MTALALARRSVAAIRADIRRWEAICRRQNWAGVVDASAVARVQQLRAELWRDWRCRS